MRTTVTLDPDVDALLRKVMRERGVTFKEALNSAIRAGLQPAKGKKARKFRQKTFSMGPAPERLLDKSLAVAAGMEDEEIIRKLSLRK